MSNQSEDVAGQLEARSVVVPEIRSRQGGSALLENQLDAIRGVKVKVSVLLGDAELTVGALCDLKNGEVLRLDRQINESLELAIDGKIIARGELVVVENNLGLRIIEIAR
jgi:flagellar motor switch protein FliN